MLILFVFLLFQHSNMLQAVKENHEVEILYGTYRCTFDERDKNLLDFSLEVAYNPDSLLNRLKSMAKYFNAKEYLQRCQDSVESTNNLINKIMLFSERSPYIYCFQKFERIDEKEDKIYYTAEIKIDGKSEKDELLILRWELENDIWVLKDIYFKKDYSCKDKWR